MITSLVLGLCSSCGLFGDIPDYQGADAALEDTTPQDDVVGEDTVDDDVIGGECRQPEDCNELPNTVADCRDNSCVYECEEGFVDLDDDLEATGCECEASAEVCDGTDNDCDGIVDNLFKGGRIAAGGEHTCASTAEGQVYCWGDNTSGQLGVGNNAARSRPTDLPATTQMQISAIVAGQAHTCAIDEASSDLHCWGSNAQGQIGDGSTDDRSLPSAIGLTTPPRTVAAGDHHTCVIDANNSAYCWGDNSDGQAGINATDSHITAPTPVSGGHTFRSVDGGARHTCGLTTSGAAWCWGSDAFAQLGRPSDTGGNVLEPVRVDSQQAFVRTIANDHSSCAITSNQEIVCWGETEPTPNPAGEPASLSDLSAKSTMWCGLDADGDAHCRQLECSEADGEFTCDAPTWRELSGFDFADISVGREHVCALSQAGRAYCWGSNSKGQLGNGSTGGDADQPVVAGCE